jgi:large subunit ribosomal protein L9
MKVLLIKDVYKLGRAGDIKKVADGYGRNYLIPQGLAIPATEKTMRLAESIASKADEKRAVLSNELKGIADILSGLEVDFIVKAGETGKLYGSVSTQMIADRIKELKGVEIDRHQILTEPIRMLGEFEIPIQLTLDLMPEIKVIVRREGEAIKSQPTSTATSEGAEAEVVEAETEDSIEITEEETEA